MQSDAFAKVHLKTKCHVIGGDNSSGKKLDPILFDPH